MKALLVLCFINIFYFYYVNALDSTLDNNLFEEVLDPQLCEEQLTFLQSNPEHLFPFIDAGARTPKGILKGNFLDLGSYYQCLSIEQTLPDSVINGKYCLIELPLNFNIPDAPDVPIPWPLFDNHYQTMHIDNATLRKIQDYNSFKNGLDALYRLQHEQRDTGISLSFRLAVCIPKVCSTQQVFGTLSSNGIQIRESFCRLPNDKPWFPADYVAISVLSLLGILLILSTSYDIWHQIIKKDPKNINKLYQSFSVYNNTRRLVTYTPVPGSIECLDGIRSIAMMWVIVGHSFITQIMSGVSENLLDIADWFTSLKAVWITAAPITVDTFFMISGLLLVYTTAGKMTGMKLLKNLHIFYLNRIIRIVPVLALMILLVSSLFNWIADGPYWFFNMNQVQSCKEAWWRTLLHIQNYGDKEFMCLSHTWYLAIDMQLYIISPIILFWVLGGKRTVAWTVLLSSFFAILTTATIYNFIKKLPSATISPSRLDELFNYHRYYYTNTLTRAPPFFVGMIFGYILHLRRSQPNYEFKLLSVVFWACSLVIFCLSIYSAYPVMQFDWDNQFVDNIINSFMRPAWAIALGWLIFACQHGCAGPINWFLSLRAWKVLSRLSYAMYLVHFPLMTLSHATAVSTVYFSVSFIIFDFLAFFLLTVILSFLITLAVESPCSVILKYLLDGGNSKRLQVVTESTQEEKQTEVNSNI